MAETKLTARERVEALCDGGTFVEEFAEALTHVTDFGMAERRRPGDGVIVGHGRVEGRPVYVYAQDWSVMAGTVGAAHGEKIAYAIDRARTELGFEPSALEDALAETLAWYRVARPSHPGYANRAAELELSGAGAG